MCQPTPRAASVPTAAPEPASVPSSAPDASSEQSRANAEAGAEPAPQPASAASDPERFRCGQTTCRARAESCCSDGETGHCVRTVPPGPNDSVQLLASQMDACSAAKKLKYSLSEITRCDESADCDENQACCGMFLFGGASANLCVPFDVQDTSPCDFSELCFVGKPCATRGAVCVDGVCQKPLTKLPCGSATSPCKSGVRCAGPSDCLRGQHCQLSMMGTRCTGMLDLANTRVVCETDSDCPRQAFMCAKMRCQPSELAGIKACACP